MRLRQRLHHLTSKLKLEYEQRMHGIELASMEANQVNKEMTLQLKEALHVESDLRRQIAVLIAERDAAMKEKGQARSRVVGGEKSSGGGRHPLWNRTSAGRMDTRHSG